MVLLLILSGGVTFVVTYLSGGVFSIEYLVSFVFNTLVKWSVMLEACFDTKFGWIFFLHLVPFLLRNTVKLFFDASLEAVYYFTHKDGSQDIWTFYRARTGFPLLAKSTVQSLPATSVGVTSSTSLTPVIEESAAIESTPGTNGLTAAEVLDFWRLTYLITALDPNTTRPILNGMLRERSTLRFNGDEYLKAGAVDLFNSTPQTSYTRTSHYGITGRVSTNSVNGTFYVSYWNYQLLNYCLLYPELQFLTQNVSNQNAVANALRWSYRYSTLHRKSFIASHKLTLAKRLLGTGFYDTNLFNRNIWMSDKFSSPAASQLSLNMLAVLRNEANSITDQNALLQNNDAAKGVQNQKAWGAHWNLLYGSNLPIGREDGRMSQVPFHLLSNYESSFHFFLKRSYLFTSLGTINISVADKYDSIRGANIGINGGVTDVQPLVLNTFNRQTPFTAGLGHPSMGQTRTFTESDVITHSSEARKDVANLAARHNALTGAALETAINLSQATASSPNSSSSYWLRTLDPSAAQIAGVSFVKGVRPKRRRQCRHHPKKCARLVLSKSVLSGPKPF